MICDFSSTWLYTNSVKQVIEALRADNFTADGPKLQETIAELKTKLTPEELGRVCAKAAFQVSQSEQNN